MKMKLETITPDIARDLLKKNTHNRNVRQSHVDFLAAEMTNGRWQLTPETIAISADDRIVDGQHRLIAVIQANATIQAWVAYDCPFEVQDVIDAGSIRTVADQLHLSDGLENANISTGAARSIVSLCCSYQNYKLGVGVVRYVLECFGPQIRTVHQAMREFRPGMRTWVIGTLAFALAGDKTLLPFVQQVGSGLELKKGDPAKALRDWLTNGDGQAFSVAYRRSRMEGVLNAAFNAVSGTSLNGIRKGVQGPDYFCGKNRKFVITIREQLKQQIN